MSKMRLIFGLTLMTAIVALPATVSAQTSGSSEARAGAQQRRPARTPSGIILQNREALKLTDEQASQVREIGRALTAKNRPLQAKIREARAGRKNSEMTQEERKELRETTAPITAEVRKNTEAAREEMLAVLDADQQEAVKKLWEESRQRSRQQQRARQNSNRQNRR